MTFSTLFVTNLKFYFQTKRFIVVFPLFLVISLIPIILIATGNIPKPLNVYSFTSNGLSSFVTASALICALFAGDAISRDFSREGFFTLTQPVNRYRIMLSRFLAATIVAIITLTFSYLVPYIVSSEVFYNTVVPSLGEIIALAFIFNISLVAFSMLFSSLFKSSSVSIIVTVLIVWIVMPSISGVLQFLSIEPWFLISYAGSSISALSQENYPPHEQTINLPNGHLTIYTPYVWEATIISIVYLVLSLVIAYLIYSRRELKEI